MENDNNQNEKTEKQLQGAKALIRLEAIKAVKKLGNPDSPWTIPQEILQEIMAGYTVTNPDRLPHTTKLVEELRKEIELRYAEDEETKKLLLDSIPSMQQVRLWLKKEGWEEAIWKKVRGDSLFSPAKRAEVIEALRRRAVLTSDQAAKLYLTLSGDYAEKVEVDNKTVDTFREINNVLHKKKQETEG